MEHISNEEKANEICKRHIFDSNHFDCCMEMADWKDEKHKQEKQQWIEKAESVCAEMFLRIESELFNVGVKNTNNRKEIEDALEIGYKYFKQALKGE